MLHLRIVSPPDRTEAVLDVLRAEYAVKRILRPTTTD